MGWFDYRDKVDDIEHHHICVVCGDRWGHEDTDCDQERNKLCPIHDDLLADDPEWRAELSHV